MATTPTPGRPAQTPTRSIESGRHKIQQPVHADPNHRNCQDDCDRNQDHKFTGSIGDSDRAHRRPAPSGCRISLISFGGMRARPNRPRQEINIVINARHRTNGRRVSLSYWRASWSSTHTQRQYRFRFFQKFSAGNRVSVVGPIRA